MKFFRIKFIIYSAACLLSFGVGVFIGLRWHNQLSINTIKITPLRAGTGAFTNPLIGFDVPESIGLNNYHDLDDTLKNMIADWKARHMVDDVSIYFRRLNNGEWFGINEDEKFSPASMLKTVVMMEYFNLTQVHPEIASRRIFYDGSFNKNALETFKPSHGLEAGKWYTVSDLVERMIRDSDNNANYLLYTEHIIDVDQLSQLFASLNLSPFNFYDDSDSMSTKMYSSFFRALYNATYLNRDVSEKALKLLSESNFRDGIVGGVPNDITVAHKFGERSLAGPDSVIRELHDCGIVYYPDHPYFLCVMTKGDDFKKLSEVIKGVSKTIYRDVQNTFANQK